MKQTIRLNESELKHLIRESVKRVLNEDRNIRFNWNITVAPKDANKMYALQNKLENSKWVLDFERDAEQVETQNLSINPRGESDLYEASSFDMMKYEQISEYRQTDPMSLSDSDLRQAINYMLAYRWALKGNNAVLDDYMEEAERRGLNV